MPETTASNQGRFRPGQSGNPAGRPKGSRHATTLAIEALLEGEAEAITRKAIEAAKAGDLVAIRIVLDRVCPPRKSRSVHVELPKIDSAAGVSLAQQEVLNAVSKGELLLDEAQALSGLIEARRKAIEMEDLENRIQELEAKSGLSNAR